MLARQLCDAAQLRHELARAQVGRSRACPFDLHALIPVPDDVLYLGPDDPAAHNPRFAAAFGGDRVVCLRQLLHEVAATDLPSTAG